MNLMNELKRRNVFRIAGIYAVVGWILMQVAGTLEESLNLPAWFDSVITAGLLIGFPIALLLAWAFEMTPEGVRPTETIEGDANTPSSSKKMDGVIIIGIILILALGLWQQLYKPEVIYIDPAIKSNGTSEFSTNVLKRSPEEIEVLDASIAVLPFSDLSQAGDQGYFSDGIAEEILNVLVSVDGLKVASRTSAFGFKGQEALGIPHIAKKLKVRHILEGSVRKSGEMVRITAQLIDAQTDQHLWSQTYDRTLNARNIFIIQDEISSEIVKALRSKLKVKIGDVQGVKINTENLNAYELYLKARQKFFARSTANIPEIIELAKQATDLDPTFAEAWAGLSAAYAVAPSWGVAGDDHIENSNIAAEKAISIDPNLSLSYAVLQSNLQYFIPIDFEKLFEYSNKALSLDPSNTTALLWRGIDEVVLGYFARANAHFKKCLEIDPAYQNCKRFMAVSKLYSGKTGEAFYLFDEGMANGSTSQMGPFQRTLLINGDHQAGLYLGVLDTFGLKDIGSFDVFLRRWTDPNFDFERELAHLLAKMKIDTGHAFNWNENYYAPSIAYQFKQYDKITPAYHLMFWWERSDPEFLRSPHRKRLIREIGIYDYWRKYGYPPQCRAVGDDDFECD